MRRLHLIAAFSFALTLGGCADNAILTVSVRLPAPEPGRNFAFVQARSGEESDLTLDWDDHSSLDGETLTVGGVMWDFSVEARGDQVERPLLVKIRYCNTATCASETLEPAEQHFLFARAFYYGERTTYSPADLRIPSPDGVTLTRVGRCDVFGCIGGESTSGCSGDDGLGTHYCEQ
jgi:hypothetical protein